ncbi:hypothetical protein GOV14_03760 [Candidatus Pacearchaeota archaeon]|nr:hypothetical protein [Candidatus Pacearchaeota archaeon]
MTEKTKYFYVEKQIKCNSTEPTLTDNVCNVRSKQVIKISPGEILPEQGKPKFHECSYTGNDQCDACGGYDVTFHKVVEYDQTFKDMLDLARSKEKLEEIVGTEK